jgi:hypothetical protein
VASLTTITGGDIVEVERNGHRAYAVVEDKRKGEIDIRPITPGFTWRTATSRQVVNHWRKTKNTRRTGTTGQDAD